MQQEHKQTMTFSTREYERSHGAKANTIHCPTPPVVRAEPLPASEHADWYAVTLRDGRTILMSVPKE